MTIEQLIDGSESMTDLEKDCFKAFLPGMDKHEVKRLRTILETERDGIAAIHAKHSKEAVAINTDIDAFEAHVNDGKRILDVISKK